MPHAAGDCRQDHGAGLMDQLERFAGFRILVVEDEALIGMLMEDYLTELGFAIVEVAGTVERALAIANDPEQAIDGAILDVNLGSERAFPVADALAERGIPFVFATGYGPRGLLPRYASYPVLSKPFGLEPLKELLLSTFA